MVIKMSNKSSATVVDELLRLFREHGVPVKMIIGRDKQFSEKEFEKLIAPERIHHTA